MKWINRVVVGIAIVALSFGTQAQQRNLTIQKSGGNRIALVIGNDSYKQVEVLRNARADARAMAAALTNAGFTVTLQLDADQSTMKSAVRNFKARISGGDEAIFYYSGHGVQLGTSNYLLPVDIRGENEEQIKDDAVPLQRVLDDLQDQKARFSLAIVDACRNNPFRQAGRALGGRGLAPTTPATGQMVIYSAGTGQQALDRLGDADRNQNGLFTRVFLKEMDKPGLPVNQVLRNVREEVVRLAKTVNHEQVPALYDQALGDFFFRPGTGGAQIATINTPANDTSANDRALWDAVKDSKNVDELQTYLNKFPQGLFAELAATRIKSLRAPPVQVATIAPAPVVNRLPETTASTMTILVHPAMPVRSVRELLALTRARPGQITLGTAPRSGISIDCLQKVVPGGLNVSEVPYKTAEAMMTDLLAGHLEMACVNAGSALGEIRAGALRALAD